MAEPQPVQRAEPAQQSSDRADGIVSRVLHSQPGRWGVRGVAGLAATGAIFLAGCTGGGGNVESIHTAETLPPVAAAKATPEVKKGDPILDKNITDRISIIGQNAEIADNYVGPAFKQRYGFNPRVNFPHQNLDVNNQADRDFIADQFRLRYQDSQGRYDYFGGMVEKPNAGRFDFSYPAGPKGDVGYQVEQTFNKDGSLGNVSVKFNLQKFGEGRIRDYELAGLKASLPQDVADLIHLVSRTGGEGGGNYLYVDPQNLPRFAELTLNIPTGLEWKLSNQATSFKEDSGQTSIARTEFKDSAGRTVTVMAGSLGASAELFYSNNIPPPKAAQ